MVCGEDARFDDARRRTGVFSGMTPPTLVSELKEDFLCMIGVMDDPLSMLIELELGVLRSGLCASRCALGDETSLEVSRSLECICNCVSSGEEAGRGVAEAVSSDRHCKVSERFAPVVFDDGGNDGDAMSLECSAADVSRPLRSMMAGSSRCCHSRVQWRCFKQNNGIVTEIILSR